MLFRTSASSIQFNTKKVFCNVVEKAYSVPANKYVQNLEEERIKKNQRCLAKVQKPKRKYYANKKTLTGYGGKFRDESINMLPSDKADLIEKALVQQILDLHKDPSFLEKETQAQSQSSKWRDARKILVTASQAGPIAKSRSSSSFKNKLKSADTLFSTPATRHGIYFEDMALQKFSEVQKKKVGRCGLFLHPRILFLGASPDGILEDESGIVEIKCPYYTNAKTKANPQGIIPKSIKDAIEKKLGNIPNFLKLQNGKIKLNPNHNYYYQIQMQLEVTGKSACYFVTYLNIEEEKVLDISIEKIKRDSFFWKKIESKLIDFFHGSKLPNLINNRRNDNLLDYTKWNLNNNTNKLYKN